MNQALTDGAAFTLTVLLNGIWQDALLAAAAWGVLRSSPAANATTRHAVLAATLVAAVIVPIATTAGVFAHRNAIPALPAASVNAAVGAIRRPEPVVRAQGTVRRTEPVLRRPIDSAASKAFAAPRRVTLPPLVVVALVVAWAAVVLALLIRLGLSLLFLERLKRDSLPLPPADRERLSRWTAVGKGGRDVRLCRSSEIEVPIAVGIFDAMVLVPQHLIDELPDEDLDRILLHELAHLRRADDWMNALERFAEATLFFNPAIRWLTRQLDVEREVACDDWVLERRAEALPYAQCLVKLVENVAWPYRPMTAPGVFASRRSISIRIERLLAKHRDVKLRVSPIPIVAIAGTAVAAGLLATLVAPSIAAGIASTPVANAVAIHANAPPMAAKKPDSLRSADHASTPPPARPARVPSPIATTTLAQPLPTAVAHTTLSVHESIRMTESHRAFTMKTKVSSAILRPVPSAVVALEAPSTPAPRPASSGEDYVSELARAGYSDLTVEQLIRLKSLGVTGAYLRGLQAAGLDHPSIDEVQKLRALGVDGPYAVDMRRLFPNASVENLASLRALGVTQDYASQLRAAGVASLTLDNLRSLRAVGVDPDDVRALARAGYPNLSAEQLRELRALGIDGAFVRKVQQHGLHGLSIDELIRLKVSGVISQ